MSRTIQRVAFVTATLFITASAWAESNGDTYIPDAPAMISKGVPPCYQALLDWAAANAQGDGTAPAPPASVTEKCALKNERSVKTVPDKKSDDYLQNN